MSSMFPSTPFRCHCIQFGATAKRRWKRPDAESRRSSVDCYVMRRQREASVNNVDGGAGWRARYEGKQSCGYQGPRRKQRRASMDGSSELLASCAPAAQKGADSATVGNGRPVRTTPTVQDPTRACQAPANTPAETVSCRKPVGGITTRRPGAGWVKRSICGKGPRVTNGDGRWRPSTRVRPKGDRRSQASVGKQWRFGARLDVRTSWSSVTRRERCGDRAKRQDFTGVPRVKSTRKSRLGALSKRCSTVGDTHGVG